MRWISGVDDSWYCWQAQIDGLPTQNTYNDYNSTRRPGIATTVTGNGWFLDNAGGLFTSHVHMNEQQGGNVAGNLEATLYVPKIEIEIADYDSAQWDVLPEGKVILSDKETRIKVTMTPQVAFDPAICFSVLGNTLTVKTSGTKPSGMQIPISTANTTYSTQGNSFEIRKTLSRTELKTLGLLPQNIDIRAIK